MTNLLNKKGLLYLIAIAVMIAIISIACKKKPTEVSASFSETPSIETPDNPTPTPSGALKIEEGQNLRGLVGSYFESKEYEENGVKFRYTAEVISTTETLDSGQKIPASHLVFKGYENGVAFSREYDGGNNIKGVYILLGQDKVEAKFTETGYLYLKPYESGSTITLALTKKS